jgi:hypothetical protein
MFGFGKKSAAEQEHEAAVERSKQTVRDFVHKIAGATPEEAERKAQQLRDWCGHDHDLPFEFKRKAMARARELECAANMRICDALLHEATDEATAGRLTERNAKLVEARRYYGRACTLGAEEEWRKAYQRAEDTLRLTGISPDSPSRQSQGK